MIAQRKKNMTTLQTLKGFRDFLPPEKRERDFVVRQIVAAFETAGFEPLETPTLEYKETIMGKYGEEADKLVYEFADRGGREVAMRYDQTVPTARVMAQNLATLALPFRRYQIQNVFRADKPQKGRYREFTQCDIDVFGSTSPLADAEILATTYQAYRQIGFSKLELRVNDRQLLFATLAPFTNESVSTSSLIQSIDKLDKLPSDKVVDELVNKGLERAQATAALEAIQKTQPSQNLQEIIALASQLGVPGESLVFTPTIARGLDYYTGLIFEVVAPEFSGGSLGGGGRYDNLIKDLSGVSMPAVGIGIGFDRTVDAARELGLIKTAQAGAKVMVTVFSAQLQGQSAQIAAQLRQAGVSTELYCDDTKLGKQFKFAGRRGIPYVIVLGEDEVAQNKVTLKIMETGEQRSLSVAECIEFLQK
jgi:histidyl-tRNA synthetase